MYRYRSSKSLLDYNELESQTIYFSPPQDLNDPIEGTMDVVWQGDTIVWKNFLNHYFLCLEQMCVFALLYKDEELDKYLELAIPVFVTEQKLPTPIYRDLYSSMKCSFFSTNTVNKTIENLSCQQRPIRKNELHLSLLLLQRTAMKCIFTKYIENGMHPDTGIVEFLNEKDIMSEYSVSYQNMLKSQSEDAVDSLFFAYKKALDQVKLRSFISSKPENPISKLSFLLFDFPDRYLEAVLELVYPKWYTACFSTSCTDSKMWAHYAGNHQGVCLKFKTKKKGDMQSLPLYTMSGYSSGKGDIYGWRDRPFEEVHYTNGLTKLVFFRSLFSLSAPDLRENWYTDSKSGEVSVCVGALEHIEDNDGGCEKRILGYI